MNPIAEPCAPQPLPHLDQFRVPHVKRERSISIKTPMGAAEECIPLFQDPFDLGPQRHILRMSCASSGVDPPSAERWATLDEFEVIR